MCCRGRARATGPKQRAKTPGNSTLYKQAGLGERTGPVVVSGAGAKRGGPRISRLQWIARIDRCGPARSSGVCLNLRGVSAGGPGATR